jgi:hypothetical protein
MGYRAMRQQSSAADRQRRHRERKAKGAVYLSRELEPEVIGLLVAIGMVVKGGEKDSDEVTNAFMAFAIDALEREAALLGTRR